MAPLNAPDRAAQRERLGIASDLGIGEHGCDHGEYERGDDNLERYPLRLPAAKLASMQLYNYMYTYLAFQTAPMTDVQTIWTAGWTAGIRAPPRR